MNRYVAVVLLILGSACSKPVPLPPAEASCGLLQADIGRFVSLPDGSFMKGNKPHYPEETPRLSLHVDAFSLQAHEVTNHQFAAFVQDTGYTTDAEQGASVGGPGAGSAVFDLPGTGTVKLDPWRLVPGATWTAPTGPGSSIVAMGAYPVIHVSERDAAAYAAWAGGRLPTETEWEYAATLGLASPDVPSSGAYDADGAPVSNTWQGIFPVANTMADGFEGAAPVGCFPASRVGLYDMIGNVWEWTDTPYGPGTHTVKGGSYLCADNFCRRYRPAARQPQDSDFSSVHIGFRIAKDLPEAK
ncbi:SUMF1/EgtB/PvdO family nonheme iron enzyme [Hyphomonas sp.]|uniref:SUMF1/EgtB/PvdO family nonheme iron enzyme n=1 Tax=Hyphomonas sp. TaxID=87 RepID=UPI00356B0021